MCRNRELKNVVSTYATSCQNSFFWDAYSTILPPNYVTDSYWCAWQTVCPFLPPCSRCRQRNLIFISVQLNHMLKWVPCGFGMAAPRTMPLDPLRAVLATRFCCLLRNGSNCLQCSDEALPAQVMIATLWKRYFFSSVNLLKPSTAFQLRWLLREVECPVSERHLLPKYSIKRYDWSTMELTSRSLGEFSSSSGKLVTVHRWRWTLWRCTVITTSWQLLPNQPTWFFKKNITSIEE